MMARIRIKVEGFKDTLQISGEKDDLEKLLEQIKLTCSFTVIWRNYEVT